MNGYQARAIEKLLDAFDGVPQARKLTLEVRGIVGGDYDVVIKLKSADSRKTREQQLDVEVVPK